MHKTYINLLSREQRLVILLSEYIYICCELDYFYYSMLNKTNTAKRIFLIRKMFLFYGGYLQAFVKKEIKKS